MAKSKSTFVCTNCGASYPRWVGKCTSCGEWGTVEEQQVLAEEVKAAKQIIPQSGHVIDLNDVVIEEQPRTSTGFSEFDLALGGGLVPAQVVLFAGQPGVGKSTLLLQAAYNLAQGGASVLYASGEESVQQVTGRARRLFTQAKIPKLQLASAAGVFGLLEHIQETKPDIVVIDSIQTVFAENVNGLPGSLSQVKACTAALVSAAKQEGFSLFLVGHITKEGAIAGPKVLEHLVDTVVQLEGDELHDYRVLRVYKNRFGPVNEAGLFTMNEQGLQDIDANWQGLITEQQASVGTAKTVIWEGTRPFVIEVQALTSTTVFAYPKRVAEGVPANRLQLLCAILDRFAGAGLGNKDVYVRAAGGYKLEHPASDLAIAVAILSSIKDVPIEATDLYVGELTLSGKITLPEYLTQRLGSVLRQNISRVVLPQSVIDNKRIKLPAGVKADGVESVDTLTKRFK